MNTPSDSGTFGSQSMMNKIGSAQQAQRSAAKRRPAMSPQGNRMAKAQLTGKAPWDPFPNKLMR